MNDNHCIKDKRGLVLTFKKGFDIEKHRIILINFEISIHFHSVS
jgi:hypothetical protein